MTITVHVPIRVDLARIRSVQPLAEGGARVVFFDSAGHYVAGTVNLQRGPSARPHRPRGERPCRRRRVGRGQRAGMRKALRHPLQFGDLEQIAAVKKLPREGALSAFTFGYTILRHGTIRVVGMDEAEARAAAREELDADADLDDADPQVEPATADDEDGDIDMSRAV